MDNDGEWIKCPICENWFYEQILFCGVVFIAGGFELAVAAMLKGFCLSDGRP